MAQTPVTAWRTSSHKCGGYTGEDGEACVSVAVIVAKN